MAETRLDLKRIRPVEWSMIFGGECPTSSLKIAVILAVAAYYPASSDVLAASDRDKVSMNGIGPAQVHQGGVKDGGRLIDSILARPLFSEGRRPPSLTPRPPGQIHAPRLAGIIISGKDKIAILEDKDSAHYMFLRKGMDFEGWTLNDISAGTVQMSGYGAVRLLQPAYRSPAETLIERRAWRRMRHFRRFPDTVKGGSETGTVVASRSRE